MKKIVLTMMAFLSMTVMQAQEMNVQGERKAPKAPTAEEMTDRMAKELNLTDEQKVKVLDLNKEYQDIFKGFRGPRPPRGDFKKKTDGNTGATEQLPERQERPQMMPRRMI